MEKLTPSCFYLTNTQLTKPTRVNGPFVIVMERQPAALPKQSGTKNIITTHNPNASREAGVNCKRKKKTWMIMLDVYLSHKMYQKS